MARNGVWELQRILLRYCPTSGSSHGVREFVENGLIDFAKMNPQIDIETCLKSGHPHLWGKYITGYSRRWCIKNLSENDVSDKFELMRNTLGRKAPRHSEISNRVVEQEKISVQGVWRNMADFNQDLPEDKKLKEDVNIKYNLQDTIDEVGMAGIVHMTMEMVKAQEDKRQTAMKKLPKRVRVQPTE